VFSNPIYTHLLKEIKKPHMQKSNIFFGLVRVRYNLQCEHDVWEWFGHRKGSLQHVGTSEPLINMDTLIALVILGQFLGSTLEKFVWARRSGPVGDFGGFFDPTIGRPCNAESSHETDDGQTVSRRMLGAWTRAWVHPWNAYLS
jgi:hypothetical protein